MCKKRPYLSIITQKSPSYPIVMILSVDHDGDTPELEDGGLPMRRETYRDDGPSLRSIPCRDQTSALHNGPSNGQTQTGLPILALHKPVEQIRQEFLGYAFAIIGNGEEYPAILDSGLNVYMLARVPCSIRNDVQRLLAQPYPGQHTPLTIRYRHRKDARTVLFHQDRIDSFDRFLHQLLQIDRCCLKDIILAVQLRERRHLGHDIGHAVALTHNDIQPFADLLPSNTRPEFPPHTRRWT